MLVTFEYRPSVFGSILAILLGIVATLIGMYSNHFPQSPPLFFRALSVVIGVGAILGGIWNLTVGRRFSKELSKFLSGLRVEGNKLVLPKEMTLVRAKLLVRATMDRDGRDIDVFTETSGDAFRTNFVELEKLDYGGVVNSAYNGWLEFTGYEIEELGNVGGNVGIYPIRELDGYVIEKGVLNVSRDDAHATLSVEVEGAKILGRLSYVRGSSRGVRVEVEAKYGKPIPLRFYGEKIFEAKESGEYEFEFRFPRVGDVFLILYTGDPKITPRRLLKALGLEAPVVFGNGWRKVDAVLKLVLDVPKGKDVVDVARISLSPRWECTSCSSGQRRVPSA